MRPQDPFTRDMACVSIVAKIPVVAAIAYKTAVGGERFVTLALSTWGRSPAKERATSDLAPLCLQFLSLSSHCLSLLSLRPMLTPAHRIFPTQSPLSTHARTLGTLKTSSS